MKFSVAPKALIEPDVQLRNARFSPCGRYLLAPGFDSGIHRWLIGGADPQPLPPVTGHNGWATDVSFHPNSELTFSADSWGQLRAWNYNGENPQPVWSVTGAHDGWVRALATSPDGTTVATCGRDRHLRLFDTSTGELVRQFDQRTEDLFSIAFHPSGKSLVSGDLKGTITHWQATTGKILRQLEAPELYLYDRIQDVGGVRRLVFTPDGKTLAAAGAKPATGGFVKGHAHIHLFDFESGRLSQTLPVGKQDTDVFAHDLYFHPSGTIIAVTSGQPGNGSLIAQRPGDPGPDLTYNTGLTNCHSVSPHPDGTTIAIVSTNSGSNGNGRRLVEGEYKGNHSPVHILTLTESES